MQSMDRLYVLSWDPKTWSSALLTSLQESSHKVVRKGERERERERTSIVIFCCLLHSVVGQGTYFMSKHWLVLGVQFYTWCVPGRCFVITLWGFSTLVLTHLASRITTFQKKKLQSHTVTPWRLFMLYFTLLNDGQIPVLRSFTSQTLKNHYRGSPRLLWGSTK